MRYWGLIVGGLLIVPPSAPFADTLPDLSSREYAQACGVTPNKDCRVTLAGQVNANNGLGAMVGAKATVCLPSQSKKPSKLASRAEVLATAKWLQNHPDSQSDDFIGIVDAAKALYPCP